MSGKKASVLAVGVLLGGALSLLSLRDTPTGVRPASPPAAAANVGAEPSVVAAPATPVTQAAAAATSAEFTTADGMFSYIDRPASADAWEQKMPPPTSEKVHYVRIHADAVDAKHSPFWEKDGRFQITLPNGSEVTVKLDNTRTLDAHRFSSSGGIEGQPLGRAVFAYNNGELSALIEDPQNGVWELRAMGDGVSQLFKVDPTKIPGCGTSDAINSQKVALLERREIAAQQIAAATDGSLSTTASDSTPTSTGVAAADSLRPEIRILFAYTDTVAGLTSTAALQTQFDLALETLNGDFSRSQVAATVTFAGAILVSYSPDATAGSAADVQSTALERIATSSDGYMDSVHAERDRVAADLVCLIQAKSDTVSAGIAYMVSTPGRPTNPALGFSVVGYNYVTTGRVFSHEIGHNLGCAHDRENAKDSSGNASPGAYAYSYGYRFFGADGVQYRTIMSYSPGERLSYFSNPDITAPAPISKPLGIAAGNTGEADNARTCRQLAFEIASYRLSPQAPSNLGRLINVSTRAYVGNSGFQQLIAGFVIRGSSPELILIRAVGPTLANFSVSGTLADPKVRIVNNRNGQEITANDNWLATDAATMNSVGAFALPSGSKDAAVVTALTEGEYTAVIEGVGSTTGVALVEGYELAGSGGRIINLSTRGYADNARPMIAGFVVRADPANPGKTKRMLIRVLGPTLGVSPFNVTEAMTDPMFTLHDSNGTQILINDDWSSGSTGGDDTKPYIRIYAETLIASLNLAPQNRRDSAVLVDLPPGLYTAIVRPFEELPSQPEKPGVALVEVYEINM